MDGILTVTADTSHCSVSVTTSMAAHAVIFVTSVRCQKLRL